MLCLTCHLWVLIPSVFMQDNVHLHVAQQTLKFLKKDEIVQFEWPTCDPDLNAIEHIWERLGSCIQARTPPVNFPDVLPALQEEWVAIPQKEICVLIDKFAIHYSQITTKHRQNNEIPAQIVYTALLVT